MAQFGLNGVLEHLYTSLHGGNHYPTPDQALAAYNAAIASLPPGVDGQQIGMIAFGELVFQQLLNAGLNRGFN
jgi:hypothetical protein